MKKKRQQTKQRPKKPQPVHPRHIQPPLSELAPITPEPRRAKENTPLISRRTAVMLLLFVMGFGYEFWRRDVQQSQVTAYGEALVASLCQDQPSPPWRGFSENLYAALKRDHWSCDTQTTVGRISRNKYRADTIELVLSQPGRLLQVHIRLKMSPFTRDLYYQSYYATEGDREQSINYP